MLRAVAAMSACGGRQARAELSVVPSGLSVTQSKGAVSVISDAATTPPPLRPLFRTCAASDCRLPPFLPQAEALHLTSSSILTAECHARHPTGALAAGLHPAMSAAAAAASAAAVVSAAAVMATLCMLRSHPAVSSAPPLLHHPWTEQQTQSSGAQLWSFCCAQHAGRGHGGQRLWCKQGTPHGWLVHVYNMCTWVQAGHSTAYYLGSYSTCIWLPPTIKSAQLAPPVGFTVGAAALDRAQHSQGRP